MARVAKVPFQQSANFKSKVLELVVSFTEESEGKNYPEAEKISIKYNRANHYELINMLAFRATINK